MKIFKKHVLILLIAIAGLLMVPSICKADETVTTGDQLIQRIKDSSATGEETEIIYVSGDIKISEPIDITGKNVYIIGDGATISPANAFEGVNKTLITAGAGANVTLCGVTLTESEKYGVQAYNGGNVILDGVFISDCKYAGVLVNGGTVTIIDLALSCNGYAGIELGKGEGVTSPSEIVMNGILIDEIDEDTLFYVDTDDNPNVSLKNIDRTENRLYVVGDTIVLTDNRDMVIYESKQKGAISNVDSNKYVKVTIKYGEKTIENVLAVGSKLDDLDLSSIKNADGKKFDKFVTEDGEEFATDKEIDKDIVLEAKYTVVDEPQPDVKPSDDNKGDESSDESSDETDENNSESENQPVADNGSEEKDDSPKTGVEGTTIMVITAAAVVALAGLAVVIKKNRR